MSSISTKTTQVCIVEDHHEIRNNLVFIISACSDLICTAYKSGEEALAGFRENVPDVVLMDISLPGISGIECTRHIRELYPGTLVLMCTIFEDPVRIFDALKAGASGYILKQTAGETLLPAIRELLKGGSPMSTEISRKVVSFFHEDRPQPQSPASLTNKEQAIFELLSAGYGNKEIADQLCVSVNTVRTHIHHIYEKLHVHNRIGALNKMKKAIR